MIKITDLPQVKSNLNHAQIIMYENQTHRSGGKSLTCHKSKVILIMLKSFQKSQWSQSNSNPTVIYVISAYQKKNGVRLILIHYEMYMIKITFNLWNVDNYRL
jgi:hypothetical protein